MEKEPYTSAMGGLMYAMFRTILYIYSLVRIVSQYRVNPKPNHWLVIKHIIKYLRITMTYMLV